MRTHDDRHNPLVGIRCGQWRKEQCYTLNDIRNECGYDLSTISRFERGENDNYNILLAYVILGMTIDYKWFHETIRPWYKECMK